MSEAATPDLPLMCLRNAEGRIVTLTREKISATHSEAQHWHAISPSDPEVMAFTHYVSSQAESLRRSDGAMARVLEDLIDVLINRGLIQFTDLPDAVQVKLMERRQTRSNLGHRLQPLLLDEDNGLL